MQKAVFYVVALCCLYWKCISLADRVWSRAVIGNWQYPVENNQNWYIHIFSRSQHRPLYSHHQHFNEIGKVKKTEWMDSINWMIIHESVVKCRILLFYETIKNHFSIELWQRKWILYGNQREYLNSRRHPKSFPKAKIASKKFMVLRGLPDTALFPEFRQKYICEVCAA